MLLRLIITLLLYVRIWISADEYLSIEELVQKGIVNEYNTKSGDYQLQDIGVLKRLKFIDTEGLYIGSRNRIYKTTVENDGKLRIDAMVDVANEFQFNPFPMTFHNSSGKTTFVDPKLYLTSYDTCLSYYERSNLRRKELKNESDPYIRTREDTGKYPSNNRPFQNWIRFDGRLERRICESSYIRGLERIEVNGTEFLWACGTFASFPKAFLMNPKTLEVLKTNNSNYYDSNVMSCARWPDEPMATKFADGKLYIGSGWGLYRPDEVSPDVPYNNSTMLYSDWKMLWNGYYWPTRMAMVFGRDVRFIPFVKETKYYLYFFGHEVNPQYSYINALTRQSYRSFMVRICKNDTGFNYTAADEADPIYQRRKNLKELKHFWTSTSWFPTADDQTAFSYTSKSWGDDHHFPTKHFTSAMKFPFGCYLKRFGGAQSMNYFWGEQNMVYFNRLADVQISLEWIVEEKFKHDGDVDGHLQNFYYTKYHSNNYANMDVLPNMHTWNFLVGAFSSSGFTSTRYHGGWEGGKGQVRPSGAICQFQLGEWKTDHMLKERGIPDMLVHGEYEGQDQKNPTWEKNWPKNQRQYRFISDTEREKYNDKLPVTPINRKQEFFALYGTMQHSFYTRGMNWFQGMQPTGYWGIDFMSMPLLTEEAKNYLNEAVDCGKCRSKEELETMTKKKFESLMNHSSMAWPTDWLSYLSKYYDAFFHLNPMSVAGDNASFVLEGVEFTKMILLKKNFISFKGGSKLTPLLYMVIVSTEGDVYRVVMCDLVSFPIAQTKCAIRNTDQPYVSLIQMGMWDSKNGRNKLMPQARVSSLLSKWRLATADDYKEEELRLNPHSPLIKDVYHDNETNRLFISTGSRLMSFDISRKTICESYSTCIDCASDPFCGWVKNDMVVGDGKCQEWNNGAVQIQDVFGRGEECYNHIKGDSKQHVGGCNVVMGCNLAHSIMLKCNSSSMFRGKVYWRFTPKKKSESEYTCRPDDEDNCDHRFLLGPDGSLTILKDFFSAADYEGTYDCVGEPFDGGLEKDLEQHFVVHLDINDSTNREGIETAVKKMNVESYCPCMKTLTDRFSRNADLKKTYIKYCQS